MSLAPPFDAVWATHDVALAALTPSAWDAEPALSGIASPTWQQKAGLVAPKLGALQAARAAFAAKPDANTHATLLTAIRDLNLALGSFARVRSGAPARKDGAIKTLIRDRRDALDAAEACLTDPSLLLAFRR